MIEKIVDCLKRLFEAEQEFYKQTYENPKKELVGVQNRIFHLVDALLDSKVDGDNYEQKLNAYKKRKHWIPLHMGTPKASHINV
ncbi:hypothetical protein PHSC3_000919 [Chlamydiales bacterium STE3]|nr:hypothetical protein PHSC3_000919 [Chlamydiales bacterium STE3]